MPDISNLIQKAAEIRRDVINMLCEAGSGHLGGSLGLADVFTTLYFYELRHNSGNAEWHARDRVVLSIGHVAPVLYATLAHAGYFHPKELMQLRKEGSRLQGHPSLSHKLPGIETSSGSLGQGLSIAVGMALAMNIEKSNRKIYCILGDGELQEGSVWEAAMSAAHYRMDNLLAIVDRNEVQIDGPTRNVMDIEPLAAKWEAFGWQVFVCRGNDISDLIRTFDQVRSIKQKPSVIIANTNMGRGVRSIEGNYQWHGKVPTREQADLFIKELGF
ncbi:MAG TPA: transketolase [Bacteroidales bacterium]|nr:transketolase [Bacteroidales bacterium]